MRFAICLAVLAAGCTTTTVPLPGSEPAAGMKRQEAGASRLHRSHPVKARRSHPSRASRDLSRTPVAPTASRLAVTMYCYTGSRNAAGKWPTVGTAAANAYPLGTRLQVEGVGVVTVEDRSAPGSTDVDIYGGSDVGCEARAVQWGRRLLLVSEVR